MPPVAGEQAAQHAKGRGLAGAVGAEQAEDFAAMDLEADMIDRGECAEPPDQIVDLDDSAAAGAGTGGRASCDGT